MRFKRDFELTVRVDGGDAVVRPPMRITFDGNKSIRGGLNKITVQVFNLQERKRLALVKDAEDQVRIPLRLTVGYEGAQEQIFQGTVHTGQNERQGPDIVTTLDCLDGGFDYLNSFTSRTIVSNTGFDAVNAALRDMLGTRQGRIRQRPTLTRPKVLVGNSAQLIDEMVGPDETWYIEDEQLYIIGPGEVANRFVPVVSAATGLISTPERKNKEVTFQTLMNPSVKIGQNAKLISQTAPHLDGIYRVESINYTGDNYGEDWSMSCTGRIDRNAELVNA